VLAIVVLGGWAHSSASRSRPLTMMAGFRAFRGLDQYRMLVSGWRWYC